jgi:methyltransferase, FkbM family
MTPTKITYSGFTVYIREEREAQDVHVLNEVIGNDCYGLRKLGFTPDAVIDIGSHIGSFSLLAHSLFPNAEISCVEPEQDNFQLLKMNCPFALCSRYAISDKYSTRKIFQAKEQTGSNIVGTGNFLEHTNITRLGYHYEQAGMCITVPIHQVFSNIKGDNILLKLDCEGAEYVIFETIYPHEAERVKYIVGEYHGKFSDLKQGAFPHLKFTDLGNSLFYGH